MNHWLISDTHFGHNKLVNDGYRKEGFEETILHNCQNSIKENDILIHIGDVSFYNDFYWHSRFLETIDCKIKVLVLGNHDRRTISWYYNIGWSFVCNSFDLRIYGQVFRFTHIPIKMVDLIGADRNIHGHLHDQSHRKDRIEECNILINIEDNLAPVTLRSLLGNKFR